MGEYFDAGYLERGIERVSESVSELSDEVASALRSIRSSLSAAELEISRIDRAVDRLDDKIDTVEDAVDTMGRAMDSAADDIRSISSSVAQASQSVSSLDRALREEAAEEGKQRAKVTKRLADIHKGHEALTELWRSGMKQTAEGIAEIGRKEAELQATIAGAAGELTRELSELDAQLTAHIKDLSKLVEGIDDEAREGTDAAAAAFESLQEAGRAFGERLEAIRASGGAVVERLERLVGDGTFVARGHARRDAARLNSCGVLLLASGDPDGALSCFREAAARCGDAVEPKFNGAAALLAAGRVEEARAAAAELLREHADHPRARALAGSCQILGGDLAGAASSLAGTGDSDPAEIAAAGLAQLFAGDAPRARELLLEALRRPHPAADALARMGLDRALVPQAGRPRTDVPG